MGRVLAVCDKDRAYAVRMQEFLTGCERNPFEVHIFTDVSKLLQKGKDSPIEVLLIAESAFCEEIAEVTAAHIFILNESGLCTCSDYPNIDKYQAADRILSEILLAYTQYEEHAIPKFYQKEKAILIGVYTPVGRCLQTGFALTLAQILGKEKKVLYLNFENFSGFSQMFGKGYEKDISDLVYYFEGSREKFIYRLESITESFRGMDYVPPVMTQVSLSAVSADTWVEMLDTICKESAYQVVVLDLTSALQGLFEVLGICEKVYTIEGTDMVSFAKLCQYEQILEEDVYQGIKEKTRRCSLPVFKSIQGDMQQMIHSELAEYVKRIVEEDFSEKTGI